MLTSASSRLIRCTAITSLIFLTAACSSPQSTPTAVTPSPVAATPEPQPSIAVAATIAPKVDPFASAEDKAISAANLAQNASTIEDWALVKSKLQQAIALMKTVPANSPKRTIAQKRQAVYQKQLKVAQQKSQKLAKDNTSIQPAAKSEPAGSAVGVAAPIIANKGVTLENYERIAFGMSPDEVRSLLGTPTREEGKAPNLSWHWESPEKRTTFNIRFRNSKVVGKSFVTSNSAMP